MSSKNIIYISLLAVLTVLSSCSSESETAEGKSESASEFKERELVVNFKDTRTVLTDKNDYLAASWKKNDELSVLDMNHNSLGSVYASKNGSDVPFYGSLSCADGDDVLLFYPSLCKRCQSFNMSPDQICLSLAAQDGSLETLSKYFDYAWQNSTVNVDDELARIDVAVMNNLNAVVRFSFIDENGKDIHGVRSVAVSNIPVKGTVSMNDFSTITIPTDWSDGPNKGNYQTGAMFLTNVKNDNVYVSMFAGLDNNGNKIVNKPKFVVTTHSGKVYQGSLEGAVLERGQFYAVSVVMEENPGYIDIDGVKWAYGNLMYDNGLWHIAYNQWDYFRLVHTEDNEIHPGENMTYKWDSSTNTGGMVDLPIETYMNHQRLNYIDHFNWGVTGSKALTYSPSIYATTTSDITSLMFTDDASCSTSTTDFAESEYGDVAYWSLEGKWRMPTADEFERLRLNSFSTYGYVVLDDNEISANCDYCTVDIDGDGVDDKVVYGRIYLPGDGMQSDELVDLTDAVKTGLGLFLPLAGYRYSYNDMIGDHNEADPWGSKQNFYWTSTPQSGSQAYEMRVGRYGTHENNQPKNMGCSIRPVLVE